MQIAPFGLTSPDLLNWRRRIGEHDSLVLSNRSLAEGSLSHVDPAIRRAAIWSFVFHWGIDDHSASKLIQLIEFDSDLDVRAESLSMLVYAMNSTLIEAERSWIRDMLLQLAERQSADEDLCAAIAIHVGARHTVEKGLNRFADTGQILTQSA